MLHPDKWNPSPLAHEFLFSIIHWNHLEQAAQRILLSRLGGSSEAWMVVVEMGNRAIPNAIKSTSKTLNDTELISRIEHFLKGYERLLTKRNFWVHGILGVALEKEDSPDCAGWISSISAKGTTRHSDTRVNVTDLKGFIDDAKAFSAFGEAILNELDGESDFSEAIREMIGKPLPSLETPPLPDVLDKQTRDLPAHLLRRSTSPE